MIGKNRAATVRERWRPSGLWHGSGDPITTGCWAFFRTRCRFVYDESFKRIEIAGGQDDGATGFDIVDVDLLALLTCLDEVESFSYDPDDGRDPHLILTGTKHNREIVVEIYFAPFADDEANTLFDVNAGRWREKPADED